MNDATTRIVHCSNCGAKNRVPADKRGAIARCGKCHTPLDAEEKSEESILYKLRCTQCGAKNRVPSSRINEEAKCGKCGAYLKTDELFAPQPIIINDGNFQDKVLESPLPVLLFAWAPWCPTCRTTMPDIDALASQSKGKIRVGKVNVDSSPQLATRFNILSVPYLFIFDKGHLKESIPGALDRYQIGMKMLHYL